MSAAVQNTVRVRVQSVIVARACPWIVSAVRPALHAWAKLRRTFLRDHRLPRMAAYKQVNYEFMTHDTSNFVTTSNWKSYL